MAEQELNLLADFPAVSTKTWKDKIIADLKGADFEKKLVWRTPEGFNVQPFYTQNHYLRSGAIPLCERYENQQRMGYSSEHLCLRKCS